MEYLISCGISFSNSSLQKRSKNINTFAYSAFSFSSMGISRLSLGTVSMIIIIVSIYAGSRTRASSKAISAMGFESSFCMYLWLSFSAQ